MTKTRLLLTVTILASALVVRGQRGSVTYASRNANKFQPVPYSYGYQVSDPYGAGDYSHRQETDSSGITSGQYHVLLPDGRLQTVTYTADHVNGYRATVSYSGDPSPSPQHAHSLRSYSPAPPPPPPIISSPPLRHFPSRPRLPSLNRPIVNPFLSHPASRINNNNNNFNNNYSGRKFYPARIFKITRDPVSPDPPPQPPIPIQLEAGTLANGVDYIVDDSQLVLPEYQL